MREKTLVACVEPGNTVTRSEAVPVEEEKMDSRLHASARG
jgi:hypothetical protein